MSTASKTYVPVTIVSENEAGQIGIDEHEAPMTEKEIIARCKVLSDRGWEPQEIQVDDSQYTLYIAWWK